jgi:hypothetical protein
MVSASSEEVSLARRAPVTEPERFCGSYQGIVTLTAFESPLSVLDETEVVTYQ